MSDTKWVVFDLIGVLAEPSWQEMVPAPAIDRWKQVRLGKLGEQELWEPHVAEAYRRALCFRHDRLAFVAALKHRGCKVAIATNFSKGWLQALMDKDDRWQLFDKIVISAEVGAAKPDPGFWARVLEFAPKGSVFVDDKRENCLAAQHAGFRSIWAHAGRAVEPEIERALAQPD